MIKMKPLWLLSSLIILAIGTSFYLPDKVGKAEKPNVIIIMTDDQGYGDVGIHGHPTLRTPHLDKLGKESTRLTNFHVTPMCTPTRSQLLTGRHALSNGAHMVCSGYTFIREDIPTLADYFKADGYRTGLFGKWHLGDNYPYRPQDRGFEESVIHKGWGITCSSDHWNNDYFDDYYWHNGELEQYEGYCTDIWFSEAMQWMKEMNKKGERFLTLIPTNAPHGPLYLPEKYRKTYLDMGLNRHLASYFGMIENLDDNVGRLEEFLKSTGLRKNTILIFTTDNGNASSVKYYNAGLRGGKESLYEGGHRVPFFMRWPAGKLTRKEINQLTDVKDLLPTLADLCDVQYEPVQDFGGLSIAGVLKRSPQPELDDRKVVIQYGRKPFFRLELPKKGDAAVLWNKWRLIRGEELYDIEADKAQENNVYDQHPEVVKEMKDYYNAWWDKVQPDLQHINHIAIGSPYENPVTITSHDWLLMNSSNSWWIREGINRSGAWNIEVKKDGKYEIALHRWPKEAETPLRGAAPAYQAVDARFKEGKALPIQHANLRIAGQTHWQKIEEDALAATFEVELKAGKTQMQTWFYDKNRNQLCGAYYVYVTAL